MVDFTTSQPNRTQQFAEKAKAEQREHTRQVRAFMLRLSVVILLGVAMVCGTVIAVAFIGGGS